MREHENIREIEEGRRRLGRSLARVRSHRGLAQDTKTDLVFDFTGLQAPDVVTLALVMTARQLAHDECRRVWVKDLPDHVWNFLYATGLQSFFEFFPNSGNLEN